MNRREFLGKSAIIATAPVVTSAQAIESPDNVLRLKQDEDTNVFLPLEINGVRYLTPVYLD